VLGDGRLDDVGLDEIRRAPRRLVTLSEEMESARASVKTFLYANLYNSPAWRRRTPTPLRLSRIVFRAHRRPWPAARRPPGADSRRGLARTVADYIAGMTDSYIEQAWRRCGGRKSLNRFLYFTGRNSICAKSATALKS